MHQRSWKTLIAGGAALAAGLTMTALGAPAHAAGVPGITSDARARDEVMNYAVNLPADATRYDFNAAVSKASENGVVLAQYPEFNTFFVQSVKASFAPTLGKSLVDAGISYHSIGPTRYKTVTGAEVRTDQPQTTTAEANAVADAAGTHPTGLAADSQLNDFVPDEGDANAWGLAAIGAIDAQQVDVPREKVTVGVMDTGIDPDHQDLKEHLDPDRSVGCQVNGIPNTDPAAWKDDHYHGTHVAGTIAAVHNAYGVDGVAPDATIVAIKVSNEAGSFYPEYVACGFDWAAEHDIDVTNSSYYMDPYAFWMPNEGSQAAGLEAASRAIRYAKDLGVVSIAAEGNDNDDHDNPTIDKASPNDVEGAAAERNVEGGIDVPAMLNDSVVSVSALALPTGTDPATAKLERSGFSNYGKNSVDVAAPGSRIWSTVPTWKKNPPFGYLSGTSMASPHAAGVAALIKQIHPDYTADQTIDLLKKQAGYTYDRLAEPTDGKEYRGAGLVNALAAVLKDQPQPVLGPVEYSRDGATDWRPLADANLSGTFYVRATVGGPVTNASLKVADKEAVSATGTGAFENNEVTLVAGPYAATDLMTDAPHVEVTVSAEGRNKDARADDDVKDTIYFHVDESVHDNGAWVNSDGGWKYCYGNSSCARNKSIVIDGETYYFNDDSVMATGWVSFDSAWHWMNSSGRMAKGWTKVGGTWYYLDPKTGAMATGWTNVGGTWYYLNASGAMATGWVQVNGSWYYLNGNGSMATGWTAVNGKWYYLTGNGAMAIGWVNDGGTWYYLDASGKMVTGWVSIDGTRYHFAPSGAWLG